jgi:hypothetical protein
MSATGAEAPRRGDAAAEEDMGKPTAPANSSDQEEPHAA